jgi:hypothetical protein
MRTAVFEPDSRSIATLFSPTASQSATMPIRPEHRFFYPIDWRELSMAIRFGRAQCRCESCGRSHGQMV